jgi:hypothetical protein
MHLAVGEALLALVLYPPEGHPVTVSGDPGVEELE